MYRYREETGHFHWGARGSIEMGSGDTPVVYKIGLRMYCTHEEYCQYFVITGKGKQPLKIVYTEKKIMDMENRLVVAKREGREWNGLGIGG